VSKWQNTTDRAHDIVEIHGEGWALSYVQAQLVELRKFAWRKRQWKALDTLVEIRSGRIFFDVTLKDDPGFKFVAGGWGSEFCSVCHWELNTHGGSEHTDGYTNGREWLCAECYEKFLSPRDTGSAPNARSVLELVAAGRSPTLPLNPSSPLFLGVAVEFRQALIRRRAGRSQQAEEHAACTASGSPSFPRVSGHAAQDKLVGSLRSGAVPDARGCDQFPLRLPVHA